MYPNCLTWEKNTYHTKTFEPCSQTYENCCASKIFLVHMLSKNFKEKNKDFICSELPKISILPKNAAWSFRG